MVSLYTAIYVVIKSYPKVFGCGDEGQRFPRVSPARLSLCPSFFVSTVSL